MKILHKNAHKIRSIALIVLLIVISVNQLLLASRPALALTHSSFLDLFNKDETPAQKSFTYKIENPDEDLSTPTPTTKPWVSTPTPTAVPTSTPQPATPTPEPPADKTPGYNESLANASFADTSGGWVNGWNREGDGFTLDTTSQGNSGVNSVHLVTTADSPVSYLYSERFEINSAYTYTVEQFIKANGVGNEFNIYIDEYNAYGDWLSGQWKYKVNSEFSGIKSFQYVPTSNIVRNVRLQYFPTAGSINDVYLDTISFTKTSE